jgi:hypothetical protein
MKRILIFILVLALTWAWHSVAGAVGGSFNASTSLSSQGDALYVNIVGETDIFELDTDGNVMPTVSGTSDVFFEVTDAGSSGDIMPKDISFNQDTNGDLVPIDIP